MNKQKLLRPISLKTRYDVIVTGAGHNGLAVAGLLAKLGKTVLVLEKSDRIGGAAVTEYPWGPDYKVSSLSYVLQPPPSVVIESLDLEKYGYKVYPQYGYFAPRADGQFLDLTGDINQQATEVAEKISSAEARELMEWDKYLGDMSQIFGPLLHVVPPKFGSLKPIDIWKQFTFAWRMRGLGVDGVADVTRLMTMSASDLIDRFFTSSWLKGAMAVSGIIGAWAGPRTPGTGFVTLHHKISDFGDGGVGVWRFHEGGMGGFSQVLHNAAVAQGAVILINAGVERILAHDNQVRGVVLENGDEFYAPIVISTTHPQITLRHLREVDLPEKYTENISKLKTRGGIVKINLALDRLPEFAYKPGFSPTIHGGTIVLAESEPELELAWQQASMGEVPDLPFADISIPTVFDKTLAPPGHHIMTMFTQWAPCEWAREPNPQALEVYVKRVLDRMEAVAPGFKNSILHCQVIDQHEMQEKYGLIGGNPFHGEMSVDQLFHMRPAPGYADFKSPVKGHYVTACTHGGGGVNCVPALQVARLITGKYK